MEENKIPHDDSEEAEAPSDIPETPSDDIPPIPEAPPETPSGGSGKIIYEYAEIANQKPERIKIDTSNGFKSYHKREPKRRHVQIEAETSQDKNTDGLGIKKGTFDTMDILFGVLGFGGGNEKSGPEITK